MFCGKDIAVEVQWDDAASKVKDITFLQWKVHILFNRHQEFGQRLCFDVPSNSKALQVACDGQENDDDRESNDENDNENGKC